MAERWRVSVDRDVCQSTGMCVLNAEGYFRLHLEGEAGSAVEIARKIILANGVAGNGGPYIPQVVRDARRFVITLPERLDRVTNTDRRRTFEEVVTELEDIRV